MDRATDWNRLSGFRRRGKTFLLFFSDASNLELLTPGWLRFSVLTASPVHMRAGTLIDYQLRMRGIPLRWQSRISAWEPPLRFVDEQIRGPYKKWHHEHRFEEMEGGTLCFDVIDYSVYGGGLVNLLFVRADLTRIFEFRRTRLAQEFTKRLSMKSEM
jgi:ligand-binding SRPBCC domain-containing protein